MTTTCDDVKLRYAVNHDKSIVYFENIYDTKGNTHTEITKIDTCGNTEARWSDDNNDCTFLSLIRDTSGNIYCAGYISSDTDDGYDAIVVKFDSNLTIITKKRYSGATYNYFNQVGFNTHGEVECSGCLSFKHRSEESPSLLMVRFDKNLNILSRNLS